MSVRRMFLCNRITTLAASDFRAGYQLIQGVDASIGVVQVVKYGCRIVHFGANEIEKIAERIRDGADRVYGFPGLLCDFHDIASITREAARRL